MDFLKFTAITAAICLTAGSCRRDQVAYLAEPEEVTPPVESELTGFYLLNQGNMGTNKCTLDRFTFADGVYHRNIYSQINPEVPMALGDVGNDMQAYRDRLWIVANCSNKVEVLDLQTGMRLGQVDIPNCRYITFDGDWAYVSSYAGPVLIDEDYAQLGFVARINVNTLKEAERVTVGYQPDGIAVSGGKLYVANSGGYRVPNYENTLSVIDLATFREIEKIPIAINLSRVAADPQGRIWVASRGDYYEVESRLYCYDPEARRVIAQFDTPVTSMWLDGGDLYTVSSAFDYNTMSDRKAFSIFDTKNLAKMEDCFVADGNESKIRVPYGVAVDPRTKEIYVTDARTYVNPGYIYCFTPGGQLQWSARTGDVPSAIVFY